MNILKTNNCGLSQLHVKSSNGIALLFVMTIIFLHAALNMLEPENKYAWMLSLVAWLYGVYVSRKSLPLLIFYFFIISYLLIPWHYYFDNRQISIYTDFQGSSIVNKVSFLNTIFLVFFSYMISDINDGMLDNPLDWCFSNSYIFYLTLIPSAISIVFGLSGENIVSAGYGTGQSNKSALHEYFIVFTLFNLLFVNVKNRFQISIMILLSLIYSLKTLSFGGRIEVIQLVLLWGFVFKDFLRSYSRVYLFSIAAAMISILYAIGIIRGSLHEITMTSNLVATILDVLLRTNTNTYILGTSADVFYASMRLVGLLQIGSIDIDYRLMSFVSFIGNLPFTFSSFKDFANLASYNSGIYLTGGGALISTYLYIWLGYLGVVFGAIFLGYAIKKFYTSKSMFWRPYVIVVLVTFPRWWAYTPINLTKLCVVSFLLYASYISLASVLKNNRI